MLIQIKKNVKLQNYIIHQIILIKNNNLKINILKLF